MKSTSAAETSTQAAFPVSSVPSIVISFVPAPAGATRLVGTVGTQCFGSVSELLQVGDSEYTAFDAALVEWSPSSPSVGARLGCMSARTECRHYASRTIAPQEIVQRCRLDVASSVPFACPADCVFFEPRSISDTGWGGPSGPPA
jgi:hypothetical protein